MSLGRKHSVKMAEDVDGEIPCKKIKLDEDQCDDKSSSSPIADTTKKVTDNTNTPDPEEKPTQEMEQDADKEDETCREGEMCDSDSSVSALSDLSGLSGEESWKAQGAGPMSWVYRNMQAGVSPRSILEQIIPDAGMIPDVDDFTLWKLVINIVNEPPPRDKLPDVNTIEDVLDLMKKCHKIMVLTGAGVSVSCGIPDFRSRNGVYARLAVDFPDLPDPQAMFDIHYFRNDQRPFFKFAKEIFPGQFEPSKCHKFIKLIESHGKLLRNYTQNIDTLEQVAGIENVIQCHGSFATATCMECGYKCQGENIKDQIMKQVIPACPKCEEPNAGSVMKPDIVFFGESLPEEFHQQMAQDKDLCDLLIVIGSSLKVRPVALIPNSLPASVPQILINKEPLRGLNFDVELLGDCDRIVSELCRRLGEGWETLANQTEPLTQISVDELLTPPATPTSNMSDSITSLKHTQSNTSDIKTSLQHTQSNTSDNKTSLQNTQSKTLDNKTSLQHTQSNTSDNKTSLQNTQSNPDKQQQAESSKISADNEDIKADTTTPPGASIDKTGLVVSEQDASRCGASIQPSSSSTSHKLQPSSLSAEAEAAPSEIADCVSTQPCTDKTVSSTVADSVDVSTNTSVDQQGTETADSRCDGAESRGEAAAPGTSTSHLAAMFQPKLTKLSLAQRLGPNQYCLIAPHRYVFNEAEVFTVVDAESDWEDMYSTDSDTDQGHLGQQQDDDNNQADTKAASSDTQGDKDENKGVHDTNEKQDMKSDNKKESLDDDQEAMGMSGSVQSQTPSMGSDVESKTESVTDMTVQCSGGDTAHAASCQSTSLTPDHKPDEDPS